MSRYDSLRATPEGEARILCLIDGFSRRARSERTLEGRTKLAKLDFFLRYPKYLERALEALDVAPEVTPRSVEDDIPLTERMVRYRYGPWDPQYFSVLGRLIGKGLVEPVPDRGGYSYRTTEKGARVVRQLVEDESYDTLVSRVALIREHLDWNGSRLKEFIYETFPEIANSGWGRVI